ncbi:hypothetical protein [Nocardia caishijiensis]|uniref:Condensation domain-containing protein n=1 Tax=Nocardia caishijiensis TaxID=184756 RepID=A0ABQ6YT17_9NOCA|nr:hypothetical protein [Nocardia caishijiensis]KAF0848778.1 hypothetical protein FNL39_101206 [Nocardia caishijiensis]
MDRLTVVDEIFLRTHRGMGTPIAMQGLWRTPDAMDPALLRRIHHELSHGPLGRRVVRPRVPGARRAWQPTVRAHPLDYVAAPPLREEDILPWADTLGADLDPEFFPGWRLSAVTLTDGGTVVALTCSHTLADARGLIHAVALALRSVNGPSVASELATPRHATGATDRSGEQEAKGPSRVVDFDERPSADGNRSDWADARAQLARVLGGTARAVRHGIPRPPETVDPSSTTDRAVHSSLLSFEARQWDRVAAEAGGTPNSLFVHAVANILWATDFGDDTIAASLPVDTRDEPRVDNDLAVTEIRIDRTDTPATIRAKAREAYLRRMSAPAGLPEEILQVLPDRWAYALSRGAGERDILCSNIGTMPDILGTVGPHVCTRVAARAIHPGITVFPRTRLSGYLSRSADTYTLALVSLDTHESLAAATDRVLSKVGLSAVPW